MQKIFNDILRFKVKLALHLYFAKIKVYGKENLPKNKAVLIISNHQNALIDPILIATHTQLRPHFLTRASVFKKSFVAKMLDFIRMIPIYRVRDGIENMEKNKNTFEKSTNVLLNKGSLVIFGEGGHSTIRTLRPLKKGFARIAYQALEKNPELDLVVLPVGINYSNHKKSGSNVSILFGPTFSPKEYYPDFGQLMGATYAALEPLVTSIPGENYEQHLEQLIGNRIDLTLPDKVNEFLTKKENSAVVEKIPQPYFFNKVMKIFHMPLYWIWLYLSKKVKDPVFTATYKFIIGLVGVPLWYIILILGLGALGELNWSISWIFLGLVYLLLNRSAQA